MKDFKRVALDIKEPPKSHDKDVKKALKVKEYHDLPEVGPKYGSCQHENKEKIAMSDSNCRVCSPPSVF